MATRAGAVLAESGQGSHQDVPKSGRVFRVIVCEACGWQYGSWWPRAEVYGYWGDCPHCGRQTTVAAAYRLSLPCASVSSKGTRGSSAAQQGLML